MPQSYLQEIVKNIYFDGLNDGQKTFYWRYSPPVKIIQDIFRSYIMIFDNSITWKEDVIRAAESCKASKSKKCFLLCKLLMLGNLSS